MWVLMIENRCGLGLWALRMAAADCRDFPERVGVGYCWEKIDIFQPWWIEGNYQHVFILGIFHHLIETTWLRKKKKVSHSGKHWLV